MIKVLGILIIALTAVKCQDDYYDYDECSGSGDYDDYYGSGCDGSGENPPNGGVDGDCECSHDFVMDKNSGRNIGNCLTKLNGKYWCYVSSNSKCSDKKPSARKPSLAFSFQACEGKIKDEPFPLIAGGRKKGKGKINGKGRGSSKANSGNSKKKGRKNMKKRKTMKKRKNMKKKKNSN